MYKNIKQFGFWVMNAVVFLPIFAATVLAADASPKKDTVPPKIPEISTLPGPQGGDVGQINQYLQSDFLPRIATTVVQLAVSMSVVFLIVSSIMFLTSYGNDEKLSNAKKTALFAVIGLFISLLSYAIVQIIFYTGYTIT